MAALHLRRCQDKALLSSRFAFPSLRQLAAMWGWHRAMRLFDGPDEVHLRSLGRAELRATPVLQP